jgi:hypothetical protein
MGEARPEGRKQKADGRKRERGITLDILYRFRHTVRAACHGQAQITGHDRERGGPLRCWPNRLFMI